MTITRLKKHPIAGVMAVVMTIALTCSGAAIAAKRPAAATFYRLVQYPAAGFSGFYGQINAARHSIDMEIYELSDPMAERDLARAVSRGVMVRVLLDKAYSGGEVNHSAFSFLRSHGVQVRWAPAHYIFHIKATTFDRRVTDISTANLTAAYYATTRDAEVIDSNPVQVRAIERTFANDWAAGSRGTPRTQTVQAPGLVWSPNTAAGSAEDALVAQIQHARTALEFESEELSDTRVYTALAAAARRGVSCRIVMTASGQWTKAFTAVTRAGCRVHVFADNASTLYIHEKFILDDPGSASQSLLIGSQNASWTSLHEDRELGLVISDPHGGAAVISGVNSAFQSDFAGAKAWH